LYNPVIVGYLSANRTALYTFKPEDTAKLVFATPRSWAAVSDLLDSDLSEEVLRIKIEGNIGTAEAAGFLKYIKNSKVLPDIDAVLNGSYAQSSGSSFHGSLDVYYLLIQNLVYAIGSELKRQGDNWRRYVDNTVAFINGIENFPLELKKSYLDQLCLLDETIKKGALITQYVFNDSCSQQIAKLIQELDYIKQG